MGAWDTPPTAAELAGAGDPWAAPPTPSESGVIPKSESAARGALQGLSFGWGDEGAAAIAAALPFTDREAVGQGKTLGERYRAARDFYRNKNASAQKANPGTYLGGEITGAVLPAVVTGGSSAAAQATGKGAQLLKALGAAGQGALQGAGYSDAATAKGVASDSALGAALGSAGHAIGQGLGKVGSALVGKGRAMVASGGQRAAQQAAEESSAAVRSLESAARERAANAYRQMERIELALQNPALPQTERTALEAFKKSPEYASLVAANAKGILSAAPDALAEREAAGAVAQAERAALPQAIQNRTQELLTPQVGADVKSFLKSYAEPLIWGLGAQQGANALGMDPKQQAIAGVIAGSIGGRTRAGKALWNRINRPAHQVAIGQMLESTTNARTLGEALRQALARGAPAALTASLVDQGDAP